MDPKLLALAHFEKVILAGFAGWLLLALVGFVSTPEELSLKAQIDEKVKKIEAHMKGSTIDEAKDPGWRARLASQLDPSTLVEVPAAPVWLMHRRPKFIYQKFDSTPKLLPKHFPPVDVNADGSERGKVKIRWKLSGENDLVVCSFEVMRKKEGAAWEVIGTPALGVTEHVDEKVASRSTYFYKVVSKAVIDQSDPRLSKVEIQVPDEEATKESAEVGPIATARDIYILPSSVIEVTDNDLIARPDAKEEAQLEVYKFDPATGTFQRKTFRVIAGGDIGEVVKMRVGGKAVDVDFRTGAKLEDVWIEKRHNDQMGIDQSYEWIKVKYADGTTEDANNKERPAELPKR